MRRGSCSSAINSARAGGNTALCVLTFLESPTSTRRLQRKGKKIFTKNPDCHSSSARDPAQQFWCRMSNVLFTTPVTGTSLASESTACWELAADSLPALVHSQAWLLRDIKFKFNQDGADPCQTHVFDVQPGDQNAAGSYCDPAVGCTCWTWTSSWSESCRRNSLA